MGAFEKLRRRLHQRQLNKLLATRPTRPQSISLEAAQHIGVLFNGTELGDREVVLQYLDRLRKAGKKVKALAFMDNRADNEGFSFKNFNRKEVDFLYRPTSKDALEFAGTPFDILINLSSKSLLPLDYLAIISKARFRVGPLHQSTNAYDLMIDLGPKPQLDQLIQQIDFFLNKMKPTHEPTPA